MGSIVLMILPLFYLNLRNLIINSSISFYKGRWQCQKIRNVFLGGGGITGIAWESGVLAGLIESGVGLELADRIIGTSAGSFVGAVLANGYDMRTYYYELNERRDDRSRRFLQIFIGYGRMHLS